MNGEAAWCRAFSNGIFLPTIMMSMALSMGVIVDGIIVGNTLGSDALAAVNLVVPITLAFNTVYALCSAVGGSTLASIAKGKTGQ